MEIADKFNERRLCIEDFVFLSYFGRSDDQLDRALSQAGSSFRILNCE